MDHFGVFLAANLRDPGEMLDPSDMPRGRRKSSSSPDALRVLLVHFVRSRGSAATIGELLADPIVGALVPSLTIAELNGGAAPAAPGKRRGRPPGSGKKTGRKPGRPRGAATRTQAGRSDYDEKVMSAISASKGPVSAEQARKKIGGTPMQFRAAVERLLAAKKVKREGKARGTKYRAA
jgi:hypothetical protein